MFESRVIAFTAAYQAEVIVEQVPEPKEGEFTARAIVSLMSTGTEGICYRGLCDADTNWSRFVGRYPLRPGYCNVAEVVAVGKGVDTLAVGDRIFTFAKHQEYYTFPIDHRGLVKLPDDVTSDEGAWCKLATIAQSAVRKGEQALGETAVVVGAGPIGQMVVQHCRVQGLKEVISVDMSQQRLDVALAHGATQAFCGQAIDAQKFVEEHTNGQGAHVAYDATGHPAAFAQAQKLIRDHGFLVMVGDCPFPTQQHLAHEMLLRGLSLKGSFNEKLPPKQIEWADFHPQAALFLTFLQRKQMRVADLISHRFKPEDAPKLYADLEKDRSETLGVVFDWR